MELKILIILLGIRTIAPRGKLLPRLGLGFGSRSGLVLVLMGNQTIAPEENCPPVRVRICFRASFGVGGGIFLQQPSLFKPGNVLKKKFFFKLLIC